MFTSTAKVTAPIKLKHAAYIALHVTMQLYWRWEMEYQYKQGEQAAFDPYMAHMSTPATLTACKKVTAQ